MASRHHEQVSFDVRLELTEGIVFFGNLLHSTERLVALLNYFMRVRGE